MPPNDLGRFNGKDDLPLVGGSPPSALASQSMDSDSRLNGGILAYQGEPATTDSASADDPSNHMASDMSTGDWQSPRSGQSPSQGNMEAVDSQQSETDHAISIQGYPSQLFRVAAVVDQLNSTELGRVIGERQLHRHRARADHAFEIRVNKSHCGHRIDLLRYLAWLADRVHGGDELTSSGEVTVHGVFGILERQQYRCSLSGRTLEPETASLDHRIPVCRGGSHRLENAQVLHKDINRAKAALTNEEFIALCREVVAWADYHTMT